MTVTRRPRGPKAGRLAAGLAAMALAIAGCGAPSANGGSGAGQSAQSSSNGRIILTASSTTTGPLTDNFNPFSPTSAFVDGGTDLIYEPLYQFDTLDPAKILPWLSTTYQWGDGGKTVTVNLRHGVKWSDGKPFTSADVVFTWDLLKRFPALNTNGVPIVSASAKGPSAAVLRFSSPQYANFRFIGGQFIVPQHVWQSVKDPAKSVNKHPVGTGPFVLQSFTPQGFLLTKNPHYWQPGKPKFYGIRFLQYSSAQSGALALGAGQLDWASYFFPHMKQIYLDKSSYYHNWDPSVGLVMLIPNVTRYPLNLVDVRKAIDVAINRDFVVKTGEESLLKPAASPTGLTLPADTRYISSQYRSAHTSYDQSAARKLLEAAGLKQVNGKFVGKNGPIKLSIMVTGADADLTLDDQIIATELNAVGLSTTVQTVSPEAWTSERALGNFDLTLLPDGTTVPYLNYYYLLSSKLSAPIGKNASNNYGRWQDKQADALLARYASTNDPKQQQAALDGLESIMVQQVPDIPVCYFPDWSQYSTKQLVGWPTPSNPYWPAAVYDQPEVVALHLHPK